MKATCRATSNIAFVKYWGRLDDTLRLPMNGSVSMNLDAATTLTTVAFDPELSADTLHRKSLQLDDKQAARMFKHIDRVRAVAGIQTRAMVATQNNFPMGAGIASSASAFAALTVAACDAAGLKLNNRDLSVLARQGSGSAARSIPAGFVVWHKGKGTDSKSSYAEQIAPANHWALHDLIAVTQTEHKTTGSTAGNALVNTSPFNATRVQLAMDAVKFVRNAILKRDFTQLGEAMEAEAIRLHMIAMTSVPPIYYWNPTTMRIILAVTTWRSQGLECYFTIDAGANVHVIAQADDAEVVEKRLQALEGVQSVINSRVGDGAQLIKAHLF